MSTTHSPVTTLTQLRLDTGWPAPSTVRVVVVGEVDLATAHLLRDRLLGVLREQAPAVVVVDLAEVTFLDCTGISALVTVCKTARRTGCQVRVTHPQRIVRRVLDMTGLLGPLTAPIDQRPTTGPANPVQTGATPAAAAQRPGMMDAA